MYKMMIIIMMIPEELEFDTTQELSDVSSKMTVFASLQLHPWRSALKTLVARYTLSCIASCVMRNLGLGSPFHMQQHVKALELHDAID